MRGLGGALLLALLCIGWRGGHACSAEHILHAGETCRDVRRHYGLNKTELRRLNPDLDCDGLEEGGTVCVKATAAPHTSTAKPSAATKAPQNKNLLEVLVENVFGAEQRMMIESPNPLLYHPFPDYHLDE